MNRGGVGWSGVCAGVGVQAGYLINEDVVVRVAIILDQGASGVVTGDLDLIGVDLVVGYDVRLAVMLDHRLRW